MIDAAAFGEIIAQYEKHGWRLRRVLTSEPSRVALHAVVPDAQISVDHIDAAWFSRASKPGVTAWEIRLLSGAPYALVEVVEDSAGNDHLDGVLREAEEKIRQIVLNRIPGN